MDEDRRLNALLYRHVPEFGVGHGCAVEWDAVEGERATLLHTVLIPTYEVLQFSPDADEPYLALQMKFLAQAETEQLVSALQELPTRYRTWIGNLSLDLIPTHLLELAGANIDICHQAADRIARGIQVLAENTQAREAFKLANQAMLTQRARSIWAGSPQDERQEHPSEDNQHRWRPFQFRH